MWELDYEESWALKNWWFWTVRRLLRVPWRARRSNQSILKEISPEYSLEGLMLKLKLEYFGHLMQRTDSLEKTLMLERLKVGGQGTTKDEMVGWMASLTQLTLVWVDSGSWWWTRKAFCSPWGRKESDTNEQLNNEKSKTVFSFLSNPSSPQDWGVSKKRRDWNWEGLPEYKALHFCPLFLAWPSASSKEQTQVVNDWNNTVTGLLVPPQGIYITTCWWR